MEFYYLCGMKVTIEQIHDDTYKAECENVVAFGRTHNEALNLLIGKLIDDQIVKMGIRATDLEVKKLEIELHNDVVTCHDELLKKN
ncbi:MAG: hypothetical protein J1E16_04210 [Muribaculaceae bacterium]|nr:hypothetical protein [Muribaculaceae bacterium]